MNDARARISRDASCCGIINRHTHVRPLDGAHRSREILQRAPTLASVVALCRAVCFRVNTGPADSGDLDSSSRGASVISEHAEDGRLLHELFETASQAWPLRHARKVVAVSLSPSLFDVLRAMSMGTDSVACRSRCVNKCDRRCLTEQASPTIPGRCAVSCSLHSRWPTTPARSSVAASLQVGIARSQVGFGRQQRFLNDWCDHVGATVIPHCPPPPSARYAAHARRKRVPEWPSDAVRDCASTLSVL